MRSVLSFDTSMNRINSDPGGQHMNIIYAYITSLVYDRIMHVENDEGVVGHDLVKKKRPITAQEFLHGLGWGIEKGTSVSNYAINAIQEAFLSFMQDGVFEMEGDYPNFQFSFVKELDYPSDTQIETARKSNKYFMMAVDDLIESLTDSIKSGTPLLSRSRSSLLPLWEALEGDPLSQVYRNEMITQTLDNFPNVPEAGNIRIIELGTGTGSSTIQLIKELTDHYTNTKIELYCYEDVANQLRRARERVQGFDREFKATYQEKGIEFSYQFKTLKYTSPITLEENSIDLILSFQNLQFITHDERFIYFERLAKLLNEHGKIIITQLTSYSDTFPHPMTLMMLSTKEFHNYPTVNQMKEYVKTYFKSYKSSGLDTIWILSNPKYI